METLRKNWAFVAIGLVSLLLGGLALLTALRLRTENPVAPTAPTKQQALEGAPVPACTVTFNMGIASPSPSASPGGPTPTPDVSPSNVPSPSPSATPPVSIDVQKNADKTTALPGDTITYTVNLINNGTNPLYDVYFTENLPSYTTYKVPSMTCTTTPSGGSSSSTTFQIDNSPYNGTPDSESTGLRIFKVANNLTEANNTWDLQPGDRVTCSYQVTVDANAPGNVSLTNNVTGTGDDTNGTGGTPISDTGSTTVTVPPVGGAPTVSVVKTADKSNVVPGDTITYTVRITNPGVTPVYDAYFDENLSDNTDYDAPSMSCTKTSGGSSAGTGFEIDDLTTSQVQAVSESSSLDQFRVAGSLNENNNTWDLNQNDYITCTYRVRVLSVANGTTIINNVTGHVDNKNGDQPNETDSNQTASTTVTVSTQCNYTCSSNSQCGGGNQICYITAGQTNGVCRNQYCPTSGDCICAGTPSPTPTITTTPQVPKAGTSWPTVALVGLGLLLLTVGFAL
jgi:uncharacterized repeat protein (TIGR01451 family)